MTAAPSRPSTGGPISCWCRTCTSGRARSGSAGCASPSATSRGSGRRWATTIEATRGKSSAMPATEWREARVAEVVRETHNAATLMLDVAGWPGHRAGQHVDVRLVDPTDGYEARRSYSIASAPEDGLSITVERLEDGEVSPWFVDVAQKGDRFDVRGPFGGWFVWSAEQTAPLLLIAGGSGLVPLMSML